jgi:outer membrane protein assembly factor BamD
LQTLTDHYPLYSRSDEALMKLGDSYGRMGPRFRPRSVTAYQKVVREYPLSPYVDGAKEQLRKLEAEIPEADPVAYARMKYEVENVTPRGYWGKTWGVFSKSPDVSMAAKSGQPSMTTMRPSIPVSIPVPAGQTGGVTDVTISTDGAGGGNTSALDTQPDARASQQQQQQPAAEPAPSAAQPQPAAAVPAPAQDPKQKNGDKKQKEQKKKK